MSRSIIPPKSVFLCGVRQEWRAGQRGLTNTSKDRKFSVAPFDQLHIDNSKSEG